MYKKIQKICKILQKNTNYNVKIIKGFVKIFYSLIMLNINKRANNTQKTRR